MKKYIKIAKGAVGTAMISGAGAAVVGKMGGSTAGIDALSGMMPAVIGSGVGMGLMQDFSKLGKKAKRWKK